MSNSSKIHTTNISVSLDINIMTPTVLVKAYKRRAAGNCPSLGALKVEVKTNF